MADLAENKTIYDAVKEASTNWCYVSCGMFCLIRDFLGIKDHDDDKAATGYGICLTNTVWLSRKIVKQNSRELCLFLTEDDLRFVNRGFVFNGFSVRVWMENLERLELVRNHL